MCGGDGGGGQWLVWMEWHPAGLSVSLPLLILPCNIKSRSSLLAPAHPRAVLFLSRPRSEGWPHHGRTFHVSLSSVILIDSSTESPVHDLMLSIQAVRGLPRLRVLGIVPCIISFSSVCV